MIKVFNTKNELLEFRKTIENKSIGLVPTMGNLHEGHISLLKSSILENEISIITIFVNPKQFGPNEDFNSYPRTLNDDLTKIENLVSHTDMKNKEVIVFSPDNNTEIYPANFSTTISIGDLKNKLCGKARPIHFDGVTTVVFKLFSLIRPHIAYFGQKDFQQCVIIKKMIADLEMPVKIVTKPIIRNSLGLALSSRNQYLSEQELEMALHLSRTLKKIEECVINKKSFSEIINFELKDSRWEYLEILDAIDLSEINANTKDVIIVAAYKINNTRLLDNILVLNAR